MLSKCFTWNFTVNKKRKSFLAKFVPTDWKPILYFSSILLLIVKNWWCIKPYNLFVPLPVLNKSIFKVERLTLWYPPVSNLHIFILTLSINSSTFISKCSVCFFRLFRFRFPTYHFFFTVTNIFKTTAQTEFYARLYFLS